MKKTKISYEVVYTPSLISKVGRLMSGLDLGISGITAPITEIYSWETTTKVNEKYLNKMKKVLNQVLTENGVTDIVSIKSITN